MQVCKISRIWLFLLTFTKAFRNFMLLDELPPATNTKDGKGQLKFIFVQGTHLHYLMADTRILDTNQNCSSSLRTGKKRSQKSQGDTINIMMTILLFLCYSCVSKKAKLLKTFTGCFPHAWSLQWVKRWHKLFVLLLLKYLVQNTFWEEETASKCVCLWHCILMGLLPAGRNWNKIWIALRWVGLKAKSAVSSSTIFFICAFGRGGKTSYRVFS